MKSTGAPSTGVAERSAGVPAVRPGASGPGPSHDGRTRDAVARLLRDRGPVAAADVATELQLSEPAVRRHLDALLADGEASIRQEPRRGRRGRPARLYLLTEAGRVRFGHGYDGLAVAALRFLAETGGPAAVRAFAERRAAELVDRYRAGITDRNTVAGRVNGLAAALTAQGYAASARRANSGEQLCQHHCPVAHVAAEFPQLCEAETHAFAELLGTHVQRLATIARGDAACTTYVPLGVPDGVGPQRGDQRRIERSATTTTIPKGRREYDHRS